MSIDLISQSVLLGAQAIDNLTRTISNATTLSFSTASFATITVSSTANIDTANISTANITVANIDTLNASVFNLDTFSATTANIDTANITTANIDSAVITSLIVQTDMTANLYNSLRTDILMLSPDGLTNHLGFQLATLTNSPIAGPPSIWFGVGISNHTYAVPGWLIS